MGDRSACEHFSTRGEDGASAARVGAAAVTIPARKPAALPWARWWLERGEGRGGVRQRAAPRCVVLRELMNEAVPPRPGGLSQDDLRCVLNHRRRALSENSGKRLGDQP